MTAFPIGRTGAAVTLLALALGAQDPVPPAADLTGLSLEELMNVEVEVTSGQEEAWFRSASATFVLTSTTIQRSGMRSVPDLLRLVPGLIIAQDVPGAFSFSSRIGEVQFAGMLVLVDGQRLYPTLLRREIWQCLDLPIENIERIEVVRGPGGARWGDRAANGVINIVTVDAAAAHGTMATGLVGTEERWTATFRHGAEVAPGWDAYVYGKLANRDGGFPKTAGDRWQVNRVGFRADHRPDESTHLQIDGDVFDSFLGDSFVFIPGITNLNNIQGAHLKARAHFEHDGGDTTEVRVGLDWYDQNLDETVNNVFSDRLRWNEYLFDTTLQHTFALAETHTLTLGAAFRHLTVHNYLLSAGGGDSWNEARGDAFASWQWQASDELRVSLGANVGYQDGLESSGVDFQPIARIAWSPSDDWTVWGAVSANEEPDTKSIDGVGNLVRLRAPSLTAYELGLRRGYEDSVLIDVSGFSYHFDDELTDTQTGPGGETIFVLDGDSEIFGGECSVAWRATDAIRTTAFYALTVGNAQHRLPGTFTIEDEVPRNRAGAGVSVELGSGWQFDSNLLYTEAHFDIPTHWRLDVRLCWRPSDQTEVSIVGQDLLDPHHPENFFEEQVERGFYVLVQHRL